MKIKLTLLFFLAGSLLMGGFVLAAEVVLGEEIHIWSFDAATIEKGYTVSNPDEQFNVGILPGVLKGETDVIIKVFDHKDYVSRETYQVYASAVSEFQRVVVDWPLPEGKQIISPIYEFDIKGAADLYDPEKPLWLRVHHNTRTLEDKGVYYWHKGNQEWVEIPATEDKAEMAFKTAIHLTYAPMAVLADIIPSEGEASWYAYHGCNCAASRHYPAGTLLTVTDLNTQKQVIVEINDYGPEEWTGRLIDLDLVAFEQLTEKWRGLTQVRVEPYIITEENFEEAMPDIYG